MDHLPEDSPEDSPEDLPEGSPEASDQSLKDSIETSVTLKIYQTIEDALYNHLTKHILFDFPISLCDKLANFNSQRLSSDPYPETNRPRDQDDLNSVAYHRKIIQQTGHTSRIWISLKSKLPMNCDNNTEITSTSSASSVSEDYQQYILLDGAHRIVATYLEGNTFIPCFLIKN
jgi:hypothetical protein